MSAAPTQGSNTPFQFNYIPYPLWRRKMPPPVRWALEPLLRRHYPVVEDRRLAPTINDIVGYMGRFGLLPADMTPEEMWRSIARLPAQVSVVDPQATPAQTRQRARLPAQWEPMERIMLSWATNYPPLWDMHAQMVEGITPVANVQINVNHPVWAQAVYLYLQARGRADLARVQFYVLPTDDIWIRDYGPFVCLDEAHRRTVVEVVYDPLPNYPQGRDNRMPSVWAAHERLPVHRLDFHGEGGNVWTDGRGTLLMTNQAYRLNEGLSRDGLLKLLHSAFDFEKLLLLPRLRIEETGHIDLLVKLASEDTVLVSAPQGAFLTGGRLQTAIRLLRRARSARGYAYNLVPLPTPPLYLNWFGFPIRRSYTNALTVNGRVLVPVYGVRTDQRALRTYESAMPEHEIIPIDCTLAANGGGAVHCMTKEVPRGNA